MLALIPISKPIARKACSGFTLIELLIVLAMVGILSTLAVPSFRMLTNNQALSNAASDLLSATIQARSTALKLNLRTIVQPVSGNDWRTGWRVYVDMNTNAVYDEGVDTLIQAREPLAEDIAIANSSGSGDSNSVNLFGFNGDGFLASIGGSFNGSVLMQSNYTSRKKFIAISRVGRARVCDPTSTPGCEP
jgi:type IV fimbrial biogenesis protein FimT